MNPIECPAEVFNDKQYQSLDNLTTVCKCGHWYHIHAIMMYPSHCLFRDCDCLAFKKEDNKKYNTMGKQPGFWEKYRREMDKRCCTQDYHDYNHKKGEQKCYRCGMLLV